MRTIIANQKYQWELLVKIPRGHKFFRDKLSGKISACDDGGTCPQFTDDGPLWIQQDKPILLQERFESASMIASVPVIQERTGKRKSILSGPREIMWLVRNLGMNLKIQSLTYIDEEIKVDDYLDFVAGTFTKKFVPL